MAGVTKVQVKESTEELRDLMRRQKKALNFAKLQSLYLLKIRVADTVRYLAIIMGRSESTIHHWLRLYRLGGLEKLMEEKVKTGRPKGSTKMVDLSLNREV